MNELEILERQAGSLDAQVAAENQFTGDELASDPAAPMAASVGEELGGIILTVGSLLAMRWPSLARVYTPEKCNATGNALAPAFEKLGWNVSGGEAMVYVNAAGACLILGLETRAAIQADNQAEKVREAVQRQGEVPATPEDPQSLNVSSQMALYQ